MGSNASWSWASALVDPVTFGIGAAGSSLANSIGGTPGAMFDSLHEAVSPAIGKAGIATVNGKDVGSALATGAAQDAITAATFFGTAGVGNVVGAAVDTTTAVGEAAVVASESATAASVSAAGAAVNGGNIGTSAAIGAVGPLASSSLSSAFSGIGEAVGSSLSTSASAASTVADTTAASSVATTTNAVAPASASLSEQAYVDAYNGANASVYGTSNTYSDLAAKSAADTLDVSPEAVREAGLSHGSVVSGGSSSSSASFTMPKISAKQLLSLGAAGVAVYGGITGYNATIAGAEDEAALLRQQAAEARITGNLKTQNANTEASIAQQQASITEEEAEIAKKQAGVQADEAEIAKDRAEIAKENIGIAQDEASIAAIQADIAEKQIGIHGLQMKAEDTAFQQAAEQKVKEASQAKGKARVAAAGRGVMLESRAEAAPNMEEQDIAAEAAWAIGQMEDKTRIRQQIHLENAKIAARQAEAARIKQGIAVKNVGISARQASIAYKNAAIAYKGAAISYDKAGLSLRQVPIAGERALIAKRNALITETKSIFEPEYLEWKASSALSTGKLKATNTLISGLANGAVGAAMAFA